MKSFDPSIHFERLRPRGRARQATPVKRYCITGKPRFHTHDHALQCAKNCGLVGFHATQCPQCDAWHLLTDPAPHPSH
jgi:hypothetical protein